MTNELNLSNKEYLILKLLIDNGSTMYGLELVKKADGKLKRGTLYTTLSRMEDKGFVKSEKEGKPPAWLSAPRRMYSPSGLGSLAVDQRELHALSMIKGSYA